MGVSDAGHAKPRGRVLLVSDDARVKRHVTRALVSSGNEVQCISASDEALKNDVHARADVTILDADVGEDRLQSILTVLFEKGNDGSPPLILSREDSELALECFTGTMVKNFVGRHGGLAASPLLIDERELSITCEKLISRDIFGLDKYFTTSGTRFHRRTIVNRQDKRETMMILGTFLKQIACRSAIVTDVQTVTDELLLNAIFDAPHDESGHPKYKHLHRDADVQLAPDEEVEFIYACDGSHVGIAVVDKFGLLSKDVLARYIGQSTVEPRDGRTGAGLGFFMVFNCVTQLVFNVEEGKRTEVIALFYVRDGPKGLRTSGRSLNVFLVEGGEDQGSSSP